MARRHHIAVGDWASVARRLEELISARSAEDPVAVAVELVLLRLQQEAAGAGPPLPLAEQLQQANDRWPALMARPLLARLDPSLVQSCLDVLSPLRLRQAQGSALDAIFEGLTARRRRGEKGQFLTPRTVCTALVKLLDPQPGERVLDPACGLGGMLLATAAHRGKDAGPLLGADIDPAALRVARLGAVVAEIAGLDLEHRDSLAPGALEPHLNGPVDVILTNPPFAGEVVDAALCAAYPVTGGGRAERDALFLERCVGLLRPGGRLGIVLPHGRLVNDRDGPLRDWLLRQVQVLAVVGLPDETFQPHTSLRTALVVGRKRPLPLDPTEPLPDEAIAFCLSEKAGRDRGGRPIPRAGADPQAPAWLALDHDLNEVVDFIFDDLASVWRAHG